MLYAQKGSGETRVRVEGNNSWHCLDAAEVVARLGSSTEGLTAEEADRRLLEQGPNFLPGGKRRSVLAMLLGQFRDVMILVLLAAAGVSAVVGELQDTIAILVIVLLNAIIGTVQEFRAERAVAALRQMATPESLVMRDGTARIVPAAALVVGDVVLLEAGNQVPADLRLLESEELQVDESMLTGESQPVGKDVASLGDDAVALGDRRNLAFKSSLITRGRSLGVVVATGTSTEIGQIAALLSDESGTRTPLQVRLARFGRYLAMAVLAICAVVFVAGLLQGQPGVLMFLTTVSLAVAAIPEALPAVVTISLALGARKLILEKALVRNLPAVETLGSVTFICTDKTGTLTENRMSVECVILNGQRHPQLPVAAREVQDVPGHDQLASLETELAFVGLIALIDPPRQEAAAAVADCLAAGITPVMITGDHPGTASAIARRLGISDSPGALLTGPELATLSDTDFATRVASIRVYVRVSPEQKLRIVKALQDAGEFVAMTGDGVNDAPALKRAGIGVSMGLSGTDVAREAADMVLLHDNFATIVRAVRAGRRIFDNIRKFIKDTMSSNSGEIWTLFLAPFLGLPIPLLPIHILWINLVTDGRTDGRPAGPGLRR